MATSASASTTGSAPSIIVSSASTPEQRVHRRPSHAPEGGLSYFVSRPSTPSTPEQRVQRRPSHAPEGGMSYSTSRPSTPMQRRPSQVPPDFGRSQSISHLEMPVPRRPSLAPDFGKSYSTSRPTTPQQRRASLAPDFSRAASVPNLLQPAFLKYIPPAQRYKSFSHSIHKIPATYRPRPYFRSRRIKKGTIDRPELRQYDPRKKWITIIPICGILVGLFAIGILAFDGWRSVANHNYCPVFTDDFSEGYNSTIWSKEVQTGGFGNLEFDRTTGDSENVYVEDGHLVIKATVESEKYISSTSLVNLTSAGTCTSDTASDCVLKANSTSGEIVQPTKSGRITTKNFAVIRYGKVQIEAKLAAGDWLLSQIMLLPAENYYGAFPASGEIDMAMARGNNYSNSEGGNNIVQSDLHWGPDSDDDGWQLTSNTRAALHTTFARGYHTYGLEWSEKYLFTWIDRRLAQVLYVDFNVDFFTKGAFGSTMTNGSRIVDPWAGTNHSHSTPFDRPFYLALALGVGGTSGWFGDGIQGKPWVDSSDTARKDFWDAREQWKPTWDKGGAEMQIKKVSMWQQCDNGAQYL